MAPHNQWMPKPTWVSVSIHTFDLYVYCSRSDSLFRVPALVVPGSGRCPVFGRDEPVSIRFQIDSMQAEKYLKMIALTPQAACGLRRSDLGFAATTNDRRQLSRVKFIQLVGIRQKVQTARSGSRSDARRSTAWSTPRSPRQPPPASRARGHPKYRANGSEQTDRGRCQSRVCRVRG